MKSANVATTLRSAEATAIISNGKEPKVVGTAAHMPQLDGWSSGVTARAVACLGFLEARPRKSALGWIVTALTAP